MPLSTMAENVREMFDRLFTHYGTTDSTRSHDITKLNILLRVYQDITPVMYLNKEKDVTPPIVVKDVSYNPDGRKITNFCY